MRRGPNGSMSMATLAFLVLGGLIVLSLVLYVYLKFEVLARNLIYLRHMVHPSIVSKLRTPRHFFHSNIVARNTEAITNDRVKIYGWHLMPAGRESIDIVSPLSALDESHSDGIFDKSLLDAKRVVVFFHGIAGCRGGVWLCGSARVSLVRSLATHFGSHVVAFDYRGFGDCQGLPSEAGILEDALAAWTWVSMRVDPSKCKVALYGQSMGSAVAAKLAAELCERQQSSSSVRPSAVILDAPFTCLADAACHHPISRGVLGLLAALGGAPLRDAALRRLPDAWPTVAHVSTIARAKCPVLILANSADEVVPVQLSQKVYEAAAAATATATTGVHFSEITAPKVLTRHHVDTFTAYDWIAKVGKFLDDYA
mmetsp:Transcript_60289/g.136297  ORF Transcript_60289/g.136297 Transcript_60289/m.136297 type:complete len:369 (+) Transcript_60289:160-1266(+)